MSSAHTIHTILDRSMGRASEEEWERVESAWNKFWTSAVPALRERSFEHDGVHVEIILDWSPYRRRLLKHYNLLEPIRRGESIDPNWYAKLNQPMRLKAACSIAGNNELTQYSWYPEFFLKYYLYETFLCANLACPGSADFLNFSFKKGKEKVAEKLDLSAYYFDEWFVASIRGKVPKPIMLDPVEVVAWIRAVNPTVTQRAESGTQRALFAI